MGYHSWQWWTDTKSDLFDFVDSLWELFCRHTASNNLQGNPIHSNEETGRDAHHRIFLWTNIKVKKPLNKQLLKTIAQTVTSRIAVVIFLIETYTICYTGQLFIVRTEYLCGRIQIWENWTQVSLQERENTLPLDTTLLQQNRSHTGLFFFPLWELNIVPLGVYFNSYEGVVGCFGDLIILPAWHHLCGWFIISYTFEWTFIKYDEEDKDHI